MTANLQKRAIASGVLACALPLPVMANSPPLETWRIVLALFSTFPLNLAFLPGALVLACFLVRQAIVSSSVPAAVRRSEEYRARTRLWYWALAAGIAFDAVALVVILSIFAAW